MVKKQYRRPQGSQRRLVALEKKIDALAAPKPEGGPLHRLAGRIEHAGPTRIVAALGIWLFVATVGGIVWDYSVRGEERQARQEEAEFRRLAQVATAWELLLTRAEGDIGKGNALNTILAAQGRLSSVDLSCARIGIVEDGTCVGRPHFSNVTVRRSASRVASFCKSYGRCENPFEAVRFNEVVMTGLTAEALWLDSGWDGVTGRYWDVRNPILRRRRGPRMAMGTTLSLHDAAHFTCQDCVFAEGEMSMISFQGLKNTLLWDLDVWIPGQQDVRLQPEFFVTRLDAPVFFIHDSYQSSGDLEQMSDDQLVRGFAEFRLYERALFCVNEADFEFLRPHIRTQALAQLDLIAERIPGSEPDTAQETFALARPELVKPSETPEDVLAQKVQRYSDRTTFRAQQLLLSPNINVQFEGMNCSYSYDFVAPLLRQRLVERLRAR